MCAIRASRSGVFAIALLTAGSIGAPGTSVDPEGRDEALGRVGHRSADPAIPRALSERYGVAPGLAAMVHDHAVRADVDPEIAFRLIAIESRFDPRAVGASGERGLMQIKPSTARDYEAGLGADRLFDPAVNLRIGLRHLKREVDHFESWSLGLASYNMGRSRLTGILRSGRLPRGGYAERVLADCSVDCT